MSEAWKILAILMDNSNRAHGAYGRGYLPSWTLGERLGGDTVTDLHLINGMISS
jgi:hypothetical protein